MTREHDADEWSNTPTESEFRMGDGADLPGELRSLADDRFRMIQRLGEGGFGSVFLAFDQVLERNIAIKIPNFTLRKNRRFLERFLEEGRALAKLSHPNIVHVHDVGIFEDQTPYVIMEFAAGENLSARIRSGAIELQTVLSILLQVADGLRALHQVQITHRDLKPSNIVLDESDHVKIVDLGLAMHDGISALELGQTVEGTPHYMAPEQVRGENHRIDGRTDVWSFGVTMFRLLTGKYPFHSKERHQLSKMICKVEPKPLRQIDDSIPGELERICLKCLSKSMLDRYGNFGDIIRELTQVQGALSTNFEVTRSGAVFPEPGTNSKSLRDSVSDPLSKETLGHRSTTVDVTTRGLRSYTRQDAEFFLQLLPGSRDARGMPDSITFWLNRLNGLNPDTISSPIGLIYGPSGCGKSSFVCGGLLPHLTDVDAAYIECDGKSTETRLEQALIQLDSDLKLVTGLAEKIFHLRNLSTRESPRRIIVLDQFEQWLGSHPSFENEPLIDALRHCDGEFVSCIILVRDDYWMGVSQFLRMLDVQIQEGRNAMSLPLFDQRHAERVLTLFGQANQCLPAESQRITKDQRTFIRQAVELFSRNGKVICVHLAIFSEMMRDRPWVSGELQRIGGWQGIGVRYLEDHFSNPEAPKVYRRHFEPVTAILDRLLPAGGSNIKRTMVPEAELRRAAGFDPADERFDEVMDGLIQATRLVVGVEPETGEAGRFYQLSHDFLVAPVRTWLERIQLSSWRGRARNRYEALATQWESSQERRYLPGLYEIVPMMLAVRGEQRRRHARFQRATTRRLATGLGLAAVIGIVIWTGFFLIRADQEARTAKLQVENLLSARPAELAPIYDRLIELKSAAANELVRFPLEQSSTPWRILVARIQATDLPEQNALRLAEMVTEIPDDEVAMALRTISKFPTAVNESLTKQFESAENPKISAKLATALSSIGSLEAIQRVASLQSDPTARSWLIASFPNWCDDVKVPLSALRATADADLQYCLCLILGRCAVNSLAANELQDVIATLQDVFQNAPGGGAHSAADWALRALNGVRPRLVPQPTPPAKKDWWYVELLPGYSETMLRVPADVSKSDDRFQSAFQKSLHESGARDEYWISAREMTAKGFRAFLNVAPSDSFTAKGFGRESDQSAVKTDAAEYPARGISWFQAMEFCQAVNSHLGFKDCYATLPLDRQIDFVPHVRGFRLPWSWEWEFAALAQSQTPLPFGDLRSLGLFGTQYSGFYDLRIQSDDPVRPTGEKMPNRWGLFDGVGNVSEWVLDQGAPHVGRVIKGGSNDDSLENILPAAMPFTVEFEGHRTVGFRIIFVDPK